MSDNLREKIFELVRAFDSERRQEEAPFVPGETWVRYAGRVYDAEELIFGVDAVLDFRLTEDKYAERLENELQQFLGVRHVLLVNSGSSANLLAVSALMSKCLKERRLRPGDEIITTAAGFPTTIAPIVQNRFVPVFVDVEMGTYNAEPEQVARAVGEKTRAVLLPHTLANPFDLREIGDIAKKHNLFLIEDNCDALGSLYDGKKTGSFGDAATLSFYPAHHITCGEGGAVVTNNTELFHIARALRDWGRDCRCKGGVNNSCGRRFSGQFGTLPVGYDHKYVYSHLGYNLKMTDIQAALGCAQMKKLPAFIEARKKNFDFLRSVLLGAEDKLVLPRASVKSDPAWFAFPISVNKKSFVDRARVLSFLEKHKIETRPLFSGNLLRHPALEGVECRQVGDLLNTNRITEDTFFIGVYPGLRQVELDHMAAVLKEMVTKGC